MTTVEIVALLKDLVLSSAAITGSVVATKGLNTWKRQLRGQSEYDLSRRILVGLFKYRDAVAAVRHPLMWAHEMPVPPEDDPKGKSSDYVRFFGTSNAYQSRWGKVQSERAGLYADLLEAEAMWGGELRERFKVLFALEQELLTSIRHYVEQINPATDEASKEAIRSIDTKRRDVLYDDLSEEGDEYRRDFQRGVEEVEKFLKPKLHY